MNYAEFRERSYFTRDEVLAMARERWATVGTPDPYRRPNYRFQKRPAATEE